MRHEQLSITSNHYTVLSSFRLRHSMRTNLYISLSNTVPPNPSGDRYSLTRALALHGRNFKIQVRQWAQTKKWTTDHYPILRAHWAPNFLFLCPGALPICGIYPAHYYLRFIIPNARIILWQFYFDVFVLIYLFGLLSLQIFMFCWPCILVQA